jgi:hypothetical protein
MAAKMLKYIRLHEQEENLTKTHSSYILAPDLMKEHAIDLGTPSHFRSLGGQCCRRAPKRTASEE